MIKIPAETTARELFSMLYHGIVSKTAPPEDLHAALYQVASILADHEAMLARLFELVEPLGQTPLADPTDEEIAEAWQSFQRRHGATGEEEIVLVPKAGPVAFPQFKVAGKRADGVPILEPVDEQEGVERIAEAWREDCRVRAGHGKLGGVASGTYSGEGATVDTEGPKVGRFGGQWGATIGSLMGKLVGKGEPEGGDA